MVCLREGVTYAIKVTILLTVAMDLFVNSYRLAQENQKEQKYCLTEACIETANSLFKVRKINTYYCNDRHYFVSYSFFVYFLKYYLFEIVNG